MSAGSHGSTPAAWTLVVLGAIVGGVMKKAGLGKARQHS